MNIGIYIYEDVEVLDFSGPFEVFSIASRFLKESEKFDVFLISEKEHTIKARGNYNINSHFTFENTPNLDILIIAGGVHIQEVKKKNVIEWIKEQSKKVKIMASVCTGAFLLAEAKILTTHKVTTHWEDISDLKESYPTLNVIENVRWVDEGNILTSAGISAGIDMSLQIVSKIKNVELANQTAKQMQFDWMKN